MKILIRLGVLAVVLALGFWLYSLFFPGPEKVIRKRVNKVAELVSFGSNEGNLARVANVQQLSGYFSPDVEISVDTPSHSRETLSGRNELTRVAMGVRMNLTGLAVKFVDLSITLSPDKTEATVNLTGEARVPGDRDLFVQELKFFLRKIDGDWLIVRIETVHTLT